MRAHNLPPTLAASAVLAAIAGTGPVLAQEIQSRADSSKQDTTRPQMLSHRVNAYLASSGTLAGSEIKVTAAGDVVILDGVVADAKAKERARALAMRVSGVREVRSNLTMDRQAVATRRGPVVPDAELSKRVAEKLMRQLFPQARVERDGVSQWEVDGDGWEIEIQSDAGDITLSGHTARPQVIDDVIKTARSVPGVRSVRSVLGAQTFDRPYGYMPEWGYHPYPFPRP